MHMQKNIIKKMKKRLNVSEEYLANYLGVTPNTLTDWSKNSFWEGKNKRLYRLNQVVNILRNLNIKKPTELKNVLDNNRIVLNSDLEDLSIISYINCEVLDIKYSQILNSI